MKNTYFLNFLHQCLRSQDHILSHKKDLNLKVTTYNIDTALSLFLLRQIYSTHKIFIIENTHKKSPITWLKFYKQLGLFISYNSDENSFQTNFFLNILKNFPLKIKINLMKHLNDSSGIFNVLNIQPSIKAPSI